MYQCLHMRGQILLEGALPRITWGMPDLNQITLSGSVLSDNHTLKILNSMTVLTALCIDSEWSLESFNALSRHFGTLKHLMLSCNSSFTSVMVHTVMCSCHNLKELEGRQIKASDIIEDNRINKIENPEGGWVCTQLTNLTLQIHILGSESQMPILDNLAKLTQLISLNIGAQSYGALRHSIKLTLDQGLDHLKSLKDLQVLNLFRTDQLMTVREVKWITSNWTKLKTIKGQINPDFIEVQQLYKILESCGIGFEK
ncbi:hypothetical protein BGZ76_005826 [Entomortierella beljakovae]|nr:hypothetical protein BGZ76_005826 [Entomortierella beljakovae]